MMGRTCFSRVMAGTFIFICSAWAHAEVTVSVTITGELDEIIPILELLRDLGIGHDTLGGPGDELRLNIHSINSGGSPEAFEAVLPAPVDLAAEAAEEPKDPPLALRDLLVTPNPARPGEDVLISVRAVDRAQQIDTVVATVLGGGFDLYDNGTRGDEVADDDVWAVSVRVPEGTRVGEHSVAVTAYDAQGQPAQVADEAGELKLLMLERKFTVNR